MTAVEWLVDMLKQQGLLIGEPDNLITVKEAKEMEKQQIIDAFKNGDCNGTFETINAEQYYTSTYGS